MPLGLPFKMFLVYALPRSRTAWLAKFLSYGPFTCGHDVGIDSRSVSHFLSHFGPKMLGSVETGAQLGWRVFRHALPRAKLLVVRRPVGVVYESLAACGVHGEGVYEQLLERNALMNEMEAEGVPTIQFHELRSARACAEVFEHLLEVPFDFGHWVRMDQDNVQVDVADQVARVARNKDQLMGLKAEVQGLEKLIVDDENPPIAHVTLEPWSTHFGEEVDTIAAVHFAEVAGSDEPNRPYKLDHTLMETLHRAGVLYIVTARVNGVLAGYCTWNVSKDVESEGLLVGDQGAWFVVPQWAGLRLGHKLYKYSIGLLKELGVQNLTVHHRLRGRGADLGRYFRLLGAVPTQHTYSLWLGGKNA